MRVEAGGICEEMGNEGVVESMPEVVYGVRSRTSGKWTRAVFLEAYAPKWTERFRCNASTGGGYVIIYVRGGAREKQRRTTHSRDHGLFCRSPGENLLHLDTLDVFFDTSLLECGLEACGETLDLAHSFLLRL